MTHMAGPVVHLAGPDSTEGIGFALAGSLRRGDVVALFGDLGSGKTTLARGLLRGLGFAGEVASPTFPIVQIYEPPDVRLSLWHVDLYRVENADEFVELGLDEARREAALVVEWPERLGPGLWNDSLRLFLAADTSGGRALTASVPPAWEGRWPPR